MTGSKQHDTDDSLTSLSRRRVLQGTAGAGLFSLLASGASASGTEELVVRAEEAEVPLLKESSSVVDELKAKAEESQKPIVDYVENTDGISVKNDFWLANALLLEVDTSKVDPSELAAQDGVSDVHQNFELELPEPQSGSADAADSDVTYGLDQIDAPEAWNQFDSRGQGAKLAVLDTGVDPEHPDIDIDPENFSEFDSDGNEVDSDPHDSAYHGTHVSGTATGGDDSGTAIGVAPDATLLHSLILPNGGGSFAQIIAGMEWAVEQDADVISMSLGAPGYNAQLIEPVRNAEAAGTFVVAAAGNDGEGTSGTPGNVYDSFAVGASNESEEIASFSSGEEIDTQSAWGSNAPDDWPDSYVVPDASAPGVEVLSSYPVDHSEGPYNPISGTSMATPHMSGLVALMESAGAEDVTPDQIRSALTSTAWKPEDAPDEKDNRYGHGIVDAVAAVGRVAADSGVEGTVTDSDGNPIEGATVQLGDFPTETDENGEYRLRAASGTYELSVDAFGYADRSTTVEVGDDFVTKDFSLGDDLAVATVSGQPDGLEAGKSFDVEFEVANAESVTVERTGTFDGQAWLSVNGEDAAFGEAYSFDGVTSGTVTLTVETGDDGAGDISLETTLSGLGETVSVSTGPTPVYAEPVAVGIVDDNGGYGSDVQSLLEDEMHPRYNFSILDASEALSAAKNGDHDAYVVQHPGTDAEVVSEFADVVSTGDIGAVYLEQFGLGSDGIYQLTEATGNPASTTEAYITLAAPPVNYAVEREHAAMDGVAEEGESVTVNEPDPVSAGFFYYGGFHAYFADYEGPVSASNVAETELGATPTGNGLAVDDLSRVSLAASLGVSSYVGGDVFTDDGKAVLGNLVRHAAKTPPVEVTGMPAEKIAPGESTSLEMEVSDLTEMEIDVSGLAYLDESDLTLTVDGDQVELGETIEYDEYEGTIEATIETTADAIGEFAFDARFVGLDAGGREVETSATLRPTAVYTSPVSVPSDIDDLQGAVDFVRSGDAVEVAGGTYELAADRGDQTGLYVGSPGITIRGAEDETVEILHAENPPAPDVINVDADDVTIENVSANVTGGEVDDDIGFGVRVNESVSGTTVRNVTAGGTTGVFFDQNTSDITVESVTAIDSTIGVGTDISGGGPVSNVTVTDVTVEDPSDFGWGGVYVENGDQVTVTDCDVTYPEGYTGGIVLWGDITASDDNRIADNTVVGPDAGDDDAGIYTDDAHVVVENNDVTDASIGIRVGDYGFGDRDVTIADNTVENAATGYFQTGDYVTLERNVFDADTGLDLTGDLYRPAADATVARYNDLSATDLPFVGSPDDGYGDPEGPFDLRMNYLGDRSYDETIADGEIVYDPFLTAPPAEVDQSETTQIATDLYLDAGTAYGLGVPGGTDKTIYEILGVDNFREFAGTMEYWDSKPGKWKKVRGQGRNKRVDTLDAFRVTPDKGVRAVVDFRTRDDVPPGHHESDPGTTTLERGWNVVAAPQFGDASEVFGDAVEEVDDAFASPDSQLGDGDVQAFTAYRVKASESTELEAGLGDYAPTMTELYESLGLDPVIHEGVGTDAEPSELDVTVADVLEAASDDEALDAVASFAARRIGQRLADVDDVEAAGEEITSAASAIVDEAPSARSDLVEDAVTRVANIAVRSTFDAVEVVDDEDADYDTDAAQAAAENAGDAASSVSLAESVALD